MQRLQVLVLRRQAALARDVHDQEHLALIGGEVDLLPVDVLDLEGEGRRDGLLGGRLLLLRGGGRDGDEDAEARQQAGSHGEFPAHGSMGTALRRAGAHADLSRGARPSA